MSNEMFPRSDTTARGTAEACQTNRETDPRPRSYPTPTPAGHLREPSISSPATGAPPTPARDHGPCDGGVVVCVGVCGHDEGNLAKTKKEIKASNGVTAEAERHRLRQLHLKTCREPRPRSKILT
ncbi:hypothetical protein EYF80_053029 [Liparis tanakae]|uniref:Uncharacterized protein n=1 Tax=Liparis tanakae TaxID=230148 RepID=A0A4Z2F6L1_9TELE|nr:hypothetical protein EYF80_053029 [Liparis tanakae]